MSRRTFAVLHGVELTDDGEERLVLLERVELRGSHDWEKENPPPVLYDGQLYTEVPPHLRRAPTSLMRPAHQPTNELEIPYVLALVYDVGVDEIAERLYAPGEANELVERVREPLEQLWAAVDGAIAAGQNPALGAKHEEAITGTMLAAETILNALEAPAEEG